MRSIWTTNLSLLTVQVETLLDAIATLRGAAPSVEEPQRSPPSTWSSLGLLLLLVQRTLVPVPVGAEIVTVERAPRYTPCAIHPARVQSMLALRGAHLVLATIAPRLRLAQVGHQFLTAHLCPPMQEMAFRSRAQSALQEAPDTLMPYRQLLCVRLRTLQSSSAVTSTWMTRRCRLPALLEHHFLATANLRGQAPFVAMRLNSRPLDRHARRTSVTVLAAAAWLMAVPAPRSMLFAVAYKCDHAQALRDMQLS